MNRQKVVHLQLKTPEKVIISREKAVAFKDWLTGR